MKISIIGGTGKLGSGLARRFLSKGFPVMIGSREKHRADLKVTEFKEEFENVEVYGDEFPEAAKWGEIIFVTVPYRAQLDTIKQIKEDVLDKIVVDTTVPLNPKNPTDQLDLESSAAENISNVLGERVKVVSGFHTVSHTVLNNINSDLDGDVLVCGDDEEAVKKVCSLVVDISGSPVHAGGLKNARVLERLTPMIIGMNKRYKKRHIGIKMTGL